MKTPLKKLSSLTIFFPFFNDEGTVKKAIADAYYYGSQVTSDLEVIAIHGGKSMDDTFKKILEAKAQHPDLIVIDKHANKEGYAVIKHGFEKATKDWIFYTDGDLQYDIADIKRLVNKQTKTNADIVNGYKINRADTVSRQLFGYIYKIMSQILFRLPIRDVDCDFRLMRRSVVNRFKLQSRNSSILLELIKNLELHGATFAQVEVKHYKRVYGKSNYSLLGLILEKLFGDITFFIEGRINAKHVTKEIKKPA